MIMMRSLGHSSRLLCRSVSRGTRPITPAFLNLDRHRRAFHGSTAFWGVRSQVLKDVGEGITEVQIIQWYVEEGAHVEEWKPLCQYQSDKAVDDITSRYAGVIKKLHFQTDDTVPTGRALCDIEVDDALYPDDNIPAQATNKEPAKPDTEEPATVSENVQPTETRIEVTSEQKENSPSRYASLATPAVRGMLKTHNLNILDITGTGKDGRVLKEDVLRFISERDQLRTTGATASVVPPSTATRALASSDSPQVETTQPLTYIQSQMFKTMTKSLTIPHLLYADELNINTMTALRRKLASDPNNTQKVTSLAFIVKAVSLALEEYPILNAKVDISDPSAPKLIMRVNHNIGIGMDTPQGLIVPNIKNVGAKSIFEIAAEISRLSALGKEGKLKPADITGGTITVSNIGNIGGTYLAPVIVPTEVAILGVGRSRILPVFDANGQVTKGEIVNFSWSADHRVIDGATMARMASKVKEYVESPDKMLIRLR
ncbi:biotin-dependent 2-oxo acid dehydrogenases acyltransferase, putative [Talaromyces stipitatus ATCC 10500]|uniref:Dihydrolipoamide acetyltransferase component of pyruvate dehydrogenase complex n=1 Tax=Talaromyces stipitatus (strain ATCC 10500 / CBS 375.48 / QM 6759 / NRRL 1006) TaxID=441959 RepID=B8LWE6_TALSN|nr:biotin-dependent 2-oxo acid dehydrogenases acyltransferase, putative [Talaromyces stipitatus ATCC 10500]EED24257.1 biotin-dependent 2-oxo acid dehydrogenases acyltransferase, putative [Talaromyces stipitatus ATCC 10500]